MGAQRRNVVEKQYGVLIEKIACHRKGNCVALRLTVVKNLMSLLVAAETGRSSES